MYRRVVRLVRARKRDLIAGLWIYFKRGHSSYFVYILTFLNFIVIQYRLLIEKLTILSHIPIISFFISSLASFALTILFVYVPLCIVVGWIDVKKFSGPTESVIRAEVDPYSRDIALALYLICQGKTQEAMKVLERWLPENFKVRQHRSQIH